MSAAVMNQMPNSVNGNNASNTNNNNGGNNQNQGKTSLFVGDLSIFCSEQELEKTFAPFGTLVEIKIMRSEETSRNLSYGFVKFATANSAKAAMNELNGIMLCGRQMR